jgi:hypothetical protein
MCSHALLATKASEAGFFIAKAFCMSSKTEVIILAKGAPVKCSNGDVTMCAIAVGEIGLIRLYPLKVIENKEIKVWSKIAVTLKRSNKDPRHESWRIEDCQFVGVIDDPQAKADLLDSCILKSGTVDPINYQNENKSSIAIVKAEGFLGGGLIARAHEDYSQFDEDETWIMTQDNYPFKPYLFWESIQGSEHKTHLVAQEVYVGMKNFSATPFRIFENMRIGDPDYQHWMVLGNIKDRRNVWVCPHIHRLKKTNLTTALSLPMSDGRSDGWPYLRQEEINAKDVGPQMHFNFIIDTID